MNPLQERAKLLREELHRQAAQEKQNQEQHRITVSQQVIEMFSTDFPELYQLLLESQISIEGEISQQGQKVVLSSADKKLSIFYEGSRNELNTWRFHGKDYTAGRKDSEQGLIIELAQAFALAQSKAEPIK